MKRPQSAKQVRNYWVQSANDEGQTDSRHVFKHGKVKMGNFVSTSNDLSRLLPKRIQQDKERLYCQSLQLKTLLNDMTDENLKLKTKVAILQKEKQRIHKTEDMRVPSRVGTVNSSDKENYVVTNLKKMVRESKDQVETLKAQLAKLKRTVRYTKLNQMQVQKQTFIEENKRQAKIIIQLQTQLEERMACQEEVQNLQKKLKQQQEETRQVAQDNAEYEELLQEMQMKNKELSEKVIVLQKKFQRDQAVGKRKVDQLTRANEILKTQKKALEGKMEEEKKLSISRANKMIRPASSHPYSQASQPSQNRSINVSKRQKEEALEYNNKLKRELEEAKQLLAASQSRLKQQFVDNDYGQSSQPFELVLTKNEVEQFVERPFKREHGVIKEEKGKQGGEKIKGHELSLALEDIRQILTYRMKYHRYTFQELKSDILDSPIKHFSSQDLITMLTEQPFFLSKDHSVQFLLHCYQDNQLSSKAKISASQLIHSLRSVINDFKLLPEEAEEQMLYKIADFVTRHRSELLKQFESYKTKDNLISKQQFQQILQKWGELGEEEIDLAICYVAVNYENMKKISYADLLEKFMIEEDHSRRGSKDLQAKAEEELSLGENQYLPDEEEEMEDEII